MVWECLNPRRTNEEEPLMVRFARAYRVSYDYFEGDFGDFLSVKRAAE